MRDVSERAVTGHAWLSSAWSVLWLWVVPQALLFFLNARMWRLVRGELSLAGLDKIAALAAVEILLFAASVGVFIYAARRRRSVNGLVWMGSIPAGIAYLWMFVASLRDVLPASVRLWMLPENEALFYQFALIMPGIFLALAALASRPSARSLKVDVGLSLAALVVPPTIFFLLSQAMTMLWTWRHKTLGSSAWMDRAMVLLLVLVLTLGTALMLAAFLRLLMYAYGWLFARRASRWLLPLLAGVVAPLAGLMLNFHIPFPYDFQSPAIYALAVLNGVLLMLPFRVRRVGSGAIWFAHAALFPFTLYFFIVFLPFLPLSILAMLAMGAGFLILAPTLLMVVHARCLWSETRALLGFSRHPWKVVLTLTVAMTLIPAGFLIRAWADRQAIRQAADAAYVPDVSRERVALHPDRIRRVLERQEEYRQGVFLPFISDAYKYIVFDGMVLPATRAETLYAMATGNMLNRTNRAGRAGAWGRGRGFLGGPVRGQRLAAGAGVRGCDVVPTNIVTQFTVTNGVAEAHVTLDLANRGPANSEYVGLLDVPEGVLVRGFWLQVGGQRVEGRLSDRRAAVWVYEMIRDVQRVDPGLLLWREDGSLELRVYPFSAGETRVCGLHLAFPAGWTPPVRLTGSPLWQDDAVPGARTDTPWISALNDWARRPAEVRAPALHLVLDSSSASVNQGRALLDRANVVIDAWPFGFEDACVTLANFESKDVRVNVKDAAAMKDAVRDIWNDASLLPRRGGFCAERAMQRVLWRRHTSPEGGQTIPVFVSIPATNSTPVAFGDMGVFQRFSPELPQHFVVESRDAAPAPWVWSARSKPVPWSALNNLPAVRTASFPDGWVVYPAELAGTAPWEALAMSRAPAPEGAEDAYAHGVRLWREWLSVAYRPALRDATRADRLKAARAAKVLLPGMAAIVVESPAQWTMLERAENTSQAAHTALAFDDVKNVPEPPLVWWLPVILWVAWRHRRRCAAV